MPPSLSRQNTEAKIRATASLSVLPIRLSTCTHVFTSAKQKNKQYIEVAHLLSTPCMQIANPQAPKGLSNITRTGVLQGCFYSLHINFRRTPSFRLPESRYRRQGKFYLVARSHSYIFGFLAKRVVLMGSSKVLHGKSVKMSWRRGKNGFYKDDSHLDCLCFSVKPYVLPLSARGDAKTIPTSLVLTFGGVMNFCPCLKYFLASFGSKFSSSSAFPSACPFLRGARGAAFAFGDALGFFGSFFFAACGAFSFCRASTTRRQQAAHATMNRCCRALIWYRIRELKFDEAASALLVSCTANKLLRTGGTQLKKT